MTEVLKNYKICVRSDARDYTKSNSPTDYTLRLNYTLQNVHSISLIDVVIPTSFFAINDNARVLEFHTGPNPHDITDPSTGIYFYLFNTQDIIPASGDVSLERIGDIFNGDGWGALTLVVGGVDSVEELLAQDPPVPGFYHLNSSFDDITITTAGTSGNFVKAEDPDSYPDSNNKGSLSYTNSTVGPVKVTIMGPGTSTLANDYICNDIFGIDGDLEIAAGATVLGGYAQGEPISTLYLRVGDEINQFRNIEMIQDVYLPTAGTVTSGGTVFAMIPVDEGAGVWFREERGHPAFGKDIITTYEFDSPQQFMKDIHIQWLQNRCGTLRPISFNGNNHTLIFYIKAARDGRY